MYYLAELYSPKPRWLALAPQERQRFFEMIGQGMAELMATGISPLTFTEIDKTQPHAPAHAFMALWQCADKAALDRLVSAIAASGWHDYFETVNIAGAGTDIASHLRQLASLAHHSS